LTDVGGGKKSKERQTCKKHVKPKKKRKSHHFFEQGGRINTTRKKKETSPRKEEGGRGEGGDTQCRHSPKKTGQVNKKKTSRDNMPFLERYEEQRAERRSGEKNFGENIRTSARKIPIDSDENNSQTEASKKEEQEEGRPSEKKHSQS